MSKKAIFQPEIYLDVKNELFGWEIDKWPPANPRKGMEYWRLTTMGGRE
jgi:hypothetical protein